MNSELQKINSLLTAISMGNKEAEKRETKQKELLEAEEKLKKEKEELEKHIKELEAELANTQPDDEISKLDAELKELETQAEPKGDEKNLIKDIDEIKEKTNTLERLSKSLAGDIENIKKDNYNWLLAEIELRDNPEENMELREKLKKKVLIQRGDNGRLTAKSIGSLIDCCLEYYANKFVILSHRERNERRKYINDVKKWVEVSQQLFEDIDKITDEYQKEFLDHVGIDFSAFNTEVEEYCKEGHQEILLLMSMIPQKMKLMLKSRQSISKDKVKDIIKYQIQIIKKDLPELLQAIPKPNPNDPNFNPEKLALLVNNRINDLAWEKFKIEEEDFINAMKKPQVATNLEINQLAMQMEMAMYQIAPGGPQGMAPGMGPGMGGMPGMY